MENIPPRRLLDQVDALRYVTAPNASTYRAVLHVCHDALQRYVIELRPHDILRALDVSGFVHEVRDVEDLELNYLPTWCGGATSHRPPTRPAWTGSRTSTAAG